MAKLYHVETNTQVFLQVEAFISQRRCVHSRCLSEVHAWSWSLPQEGLRLVASAVCHAAHRGSTRLLMSEERADKSQGSQQTRDSEEEVNRATASGTDSKPPPPPTGGGR